MLALLAWLAPRLQAQAWLLDSAVAPTLVNDAPALPGVSFVGLAGGDYLAYGGFTHVSGTAARRFVRIRASGTVDPSFNADFADNESVVRVAPLRDGRCVALVGISAPVLPVDDASVASGVQVSVAYSYRVTLIRLRADGRKDSTFAPVALDGGLVNLTPLPDGSVLVWGSFRTFGTAPRNGLARLLADGSVDPQFNPALAPTQLNIASAAAGSDGSIIVSGVAYGTSGRFASYFLTRLRPNGEVDSQFAPPNVSRTFELLAVQPDGSVLVGSGNLLRYSPAGVQDRSFTLAIPQLRTVSRMAPLPNGRLAVEAYVSGQSDLGGPALFIVRGDGTVERDLRKVPGGDEGQRLMAALPDGRILLQQGPLVLYPSYPYQLAATTVTDVTATPTIAVDPTTTNSGSVASTPATLLPIFVGPTIYNPSLAGSSADGTSIAPSALAFTSRQNAGISRIEIDSTGRALVAGQFTQINGQPRAGLARLLASGVLDESFVPVSGQLQFAPPDGRPIVMRTTLGPAASDGYHRIVTDLVRLQSSGQIDTSFSLPSGFDRTQTKFLATAADGRLLIATYVPDNSREENLKLIWLAPDGRESSRLSTVFTGFYRSIIMPLLATGGGAIPVPATTGTDGTTTATIGVTTGSPTGATTTGTISPITPVPLTVVVPPTVTPPAPPVTLDPPTTILPPTTTPPTIVAPIPYPYYRANPIDAARVTSGGGLLVSGAFLRVNGLARSDLVRLNADGSVDATYAFIGTPPPYFGFAITSVAPPPVSTTSGDPGAGTNPGSTTIGTAQPVDPNVATTVATAVAVAVASIIPTSSTYTTVLPLNDGRALVFTATYGRDGATSKLVRLRADGTVDPTFKPAPNFTVTNAQELADGSYFSNGRRFFADGSLDRNFAPRLITNPNFAGYAATAALDQNRRLWLGGYFNSVNGQPRTSLARFLSAEVVGITFQPASVTVVAGRGATFEVVIGTNQAATYRWTHDGVTVPGATTGTLTLAHVSAADAGVYRVIVTIAGQPITSDAATLTVRPNSSRLVNFSARSRVEPGGSPQIAGVVSQAAVPRPVLLRAIGRGIPGNPGLTMLPTPVLSLYEGSRMLAQDRGGALAPPIVTMASDVGAFPVAGIANSGGAVFGSALTTTLNAGNFTAMTSSGDAGSGLSLFELYDTGSTAEPPLIRNLAIRGQTGSGANVLTAGFVIAGNGPLQLLIRGIGPSLKGFGVPGTTTDAQIQVFASGSSTPLAANDDWDNADDISAAAAKTGAFPLASGSKDAALLLTLEPGAYTVQLVGANGETGAAMIEVYVVEN